MAKVLLVEDDTSLAKPLARWLQKQGYDVEMAHTGTDALQMLAAYRFDVIVLDWELPELNGIDVLKKYREQKGSTPIIFLTGRGDVASTEQGLNAGADDYLPKPFSERVLLARIGALLRRPAGLIPTVLSIGNVTLELETKKVLLNGDEVELRKKEYAVLEFLMRHPNRYFGSKELLEAVWASDTDSSEGAVRFCVSELRRKISATDGTCIVGTERGRGYIVTTE